MATVEVKEEQKVYVYLPPNYVEGKHILSWALNHFLKDKTKIVAIVIIDTNYLGTLLNECLEIRNKTLEEHLACCAIQKFQAEKLLHVTKRANLVQEILELIDLRAIKDLVMGFSSLSDLVKKKAKPSCKIWLIENGNLIYQKSIKLLHPNSVSTVATYKEIDPVDPGLNMALNLSLETGLQQREKLHKEIDEIQKRENDKNDLLEKENEELKLENQLLRNQQDDDLILFNEYERLRQQFEKCISDLEIDYDKLKQERDNAIEEAQELRKQKDLDKQKQQLEKRISDLEIDYNKLKQEHDNAIKEAQELRKQTDLDKQKKQLEKHISDLEKDYNKLKQEHDYAIKETQELRKQKEHSFANSDMVLNSQFSLSELEQATQNFSDLLKIGEGGFGCVYKGSLRKTMVAIKKLNSESLQGLSEFQQEVAILNRVRHPNIVNLIGSCSEISTLVYEYLPNGSLEDRLACVDNTLSLTWQTRTRIISEICLGLIFLHSNKPHIVIHGDLKPDNILLDANFISKLSDFGISKIIKQSDTNISAIYCTTHPAGTFSYIDPEFLSTGELTPKSDVYSFGIIVLRLLTGKRALKIASEVQDCMRSGRLLSIVDKSAGKWPFDLAKKLAKLGLRCADISRRKRPNMCQVWATIEPLVKAASLLSVGSSTSNEEHVPSHFICPIMQEIMKNPCIAADGFTYEAEAIKTWLNGGHNTSPMTNLLLPHHDLIPNHVLRSAIQEWLQHHPQSN